AGARPPPAAPAGGGLRQGCGLARRGGGAKPPRGRADSPGWGGAEKPLKKPPRRPIAKTAMPRPTDIRIESVSFDCEDHRYRSPIKFGGVALDRVTLLNVHVTVRTESGKTAGGFGSMPLGNIWSFPSRALTYDDTLGAMKAVAEQVARVYGECREVGHPIDLFH